MHKLALALPIKQPMPTCISMLVYTVFLQIVSNPIKLAHRARASRTCFSHLCFFLYCYFTVMSVLKSKFWKSYKILSKLGQIWTEICQKLSKLVQTDSILSKKTKLVKIWKKVNYKIWKMVLPVEIWPENFKIVQSWTKQYEIFD